MKTKPFYFYFLSIFLLAVVVSFPMQIILEYDYAVDDISLTWRHLTIMNYAVMVLCLVVIYDSWTVSMRLKYTALALLVVTLVNNAMVGYMAVNYSPLQTILASGLFLVPFSYMLTNSIQSLLLESRLHWWKTPRRFERDWMVKLEGFNSLAKSMNVSRTGILIQVKTDSWTKDDWALMENQLTRNLSLPIIIHMGKQNFSNDAAIVRHQFNPVSKEIQVALKFNSVNWVNSLIFERRILAT